MLLAGRAARGADAPVSYWREVRPIFIHSCVACHEPQKLKGKLNLTTYQGLRSGGKHGEGLVPGDPGKSLLITQVSGENPEMPEKGDPLRADEVAVLVRWVKEGAADDTPANALATTAPAPPSERPVYQLAPAIGALACSPDGEMLAVAGYHEILLHHADGSGLIARLSSASPRITSLVFSKDGATLMCAGGAPGMFGEIELWNVAERRRVKDFTISRDTLFGASFSPEGDRIGVGCADKTVHVIDVASGKEVLRGDLHSDWVLATCFTLDGSRLISGSRDKNLKLIPIASTQPAVDVNDAQEPITSLARHPSQDVVVVGGAQGGVRTYKVSDLQKRTEQKPDANKVRDMERQQGPVNAIVFSADGASIAMASTGEVRVYGFKDGNKLAGMGGHTGGVYGVAFSPDGKRVYTAGYDGNVRIFEVAGQKLVKTFMPVPLATTQPRTPESK